jgi:competence protein ComGC
MDAIPARLHHLLLVVVVVFILLLVPSLTAAQSRAFGGTAAYPICRSL